MREKVEKVINDLEERKKKIDAFINMARMPKYRKGGVYFEQGVLHDLRIESVVLGMVINQLKLELLGEFNCKDETLMELLREV